MPQPTKLIIEEEQKELISWGWARGSIQADDKKQFTNFTEEKHDR